MQRVTLPVDDDLLATLDRHMKKHRYASRSEALRDILREHLADEGARCETALATAEVAAIKANPPSFMRSRNVAI